MKKILLILFLITVLIGENNAQTYRQLFDNLNNTSQFRTGYNSFDSNIKSKLAFNSDVMQSYLTMYKATKDLKYLHEFVIHAKRVMDRRDDNIPNASPVLGLPIPVGACNVTSITSASFLYTGYPAWSRLEILNPNNNLCQLIPFPHFMETGGIIYPLAQFVLLTMEDPSFSSVSLPTEAAFPGVSTFGDFASWLKTNIYASLDWQISVDYNRNDQGCGGNCDAFVSQFSNGWHGINLQCAIGKPLVLMYHIAVLDNDVAHQNNYFWKIQNMAAEFKTIIQSTPSNPATVGNGLPWYTWCHATSCDGNLWEDIAHAHIDEEFAELCYMYYPWPGTHYFDLSDMQKFANGLAYRMIPQPLRITMNVYGNDDNCDQKCTNATTVLPKFNYNESGAYTFLSQYNKQIYQEISDFYVPDNAGFFGTQDLIGLQAYANLALNEHLFNPIAAWGFQDRLGNPNNSSVTWRNSASGDFNNDGSDEFAAVNDNVLAGQISIYSLTSGNVINLIANYSQPIYNDIAGGNFDPNNAGDEIAALNNSNNISLLKFDGVNAVVSLGPNVTPPETIISLSSGDFNNDGEDEIVALSNNHVFIYQILSGNISLLNSFPVSGYNKVAVGKFEGNTTEIAVLTTSGIIVIFNSTGNSLYFTQAPAGTYISMASGDYDGDGISEMMTYQSTDATFRVFKVRNGVLSYNVGDEEVFPVNQLQGVMCSCRLSNFSDKDALATFRNYDGQVNVFTMDGLCPGLQLNNQVIDNNSYMNNYANVSNNYPIDYHVNNVLSASNYSIQSPSEVDFTAGNKIILKPGFNAKSGSKFHAYISPGLSCSNNNRQNFRAINTTQPSQAHPGQAQVQRNTGSQNTIGDKMLIGVFPNPTSGILTVNFWSEQDRNINVSVEDITGKILLQQSYGASRGNGQNQIDLREFTNGMYILKLSDEKGILMKTDKIILSK